MTTGNVRRNKKKKSFNEKTTLYYYVYLAAFDPFDERFRGKSERENIRRRVPINGRWRWVGMFRCYNKLRVPYNNIV